MDLIRGGLLPLPFASAGTHRALSQVLVEDFAGIATGAFAQPDGVVEAVAPDDADRGEKAEGAAYEGDGGAGHIGGVRYIRGGRWQGVSR